MKKTLLLLAALFVGATCCRADTAVAQDNQGHYGYYIGPNVEWQKHRAIEFCQRCNSWQGHSWIVGATRNRGWGAIATFTAPNGNTFYAAALGMGSEHDARHVAREQAWRRGGGDSVQVIQTFYDSGQY